MRLSDLTTSFALIALLDRNVQATVSQVKGDSLITQIITSHAWHGTVLQTGGSRRYALCLS
jgi:hypothetical protein